MERLNGISTDGSGDKADSNKRQRPDGIAPGGRRRRTGPPETVVLLQIHIDSGGFLIHEWLPSGRCAYREVFKMHANEDWIDYLVLGMAVADRSLLKEIKGFRSKTATHLAEFIKAEERKEFLRL